MQSLQAAQDTKIEINQSNKKITIFCFVLTGPKHILNGATQVVYETWAHKCDNVKFISVFPKELLGKMNSTLQSNLVELNHGFDILQPPGLGTTFNDTYQLVNIINYFKIILKLFTYIA